MVVEARSDPSRFELSEEERRQVIERARRELPELDRELREARENLRRIGAGMEPLPSRADPPAR